jgi:hypothetical protein
MKVRLPGVPIDVEVVSEQKCLEADVIRAALPKAIYDKSVAAGDEYVPGTKGGFFCIVCGCEVVLAPSGQRIEAQGGGYTCMNCVLKAAKEEDHN